jgi:hypothetical protein
LPGRIDFDYCLGSAVKLYVMKLTNLYPLGIRYIEIKNAKACSFTVNCHEHILSLLLLLVVLVNR